MSITVTKDRMAEVLKSIQGLVSKRVLIGIPSNTAERKDDAPMNNAQIGYVMETGSPANNVPARPFLVPGTEKALPACVKTLKAGAQKALDGNEDAASRALDRAGIIASSSVRNTIGSNIPPPLAPSTIRGRKYARGTASRRTDETEYLDMVKKGLSPGTAQQISGIVALVNTGQLRNSITYVVRKAK